MPDTSITASVPSVYDPPRRQWCFRLLSAVCRRTGLWLERRRQRHMLAELTDDQLRDIGLSRSEAFREASIPFWKP